MDMGLLKGRGRGLGYKGTERELIWWGWQEGKVSGLPAMLMVLLPVREGDPSAADDESVRSWEAGFDADGAGGCGDGVLCGEGVLSTRILANISISTK
jgi:hypothetical protein